MSTTSSIATRRIPTGGPAHTLAGVIKRWWVAYVTWRIERLAISRLRAMSDRQLKDIGVARSQIEFAVRSDLDRAPLCRS